MDRVKILGAWEDINQIKVKAYHANDGLTQFRAAQYVFEKVATTEHWVDPATHEEKDDSYIPTGEFDPSYKNVLKLGKAFVAPADANGLDLSGDNVTHLIVQDDSYPSPLTVVWDPIYEGSWVQPDPMDDAHDFYYNLRYFWGIRITVYYTQETNDGMGTTYPAGYVIRHYDSTVDTFTNEGRHDFLFSGPADGWIKAKMRFYNSAGMGPYGLSSNEQYAYHDDHLNNPPV